MNHIEVPLYLYVNSCGSSRNISIKRLCDEATVKQLGFHLIPTETHEVPWRQA